jgi:hypothetical protein
LSAVDVTRVVLTITGSGIATPIVYSLRQSGGQWRGIIGAIPAGDNRTFRAEAFDASNTVVYEVERTGVTIARGVSTSVVLLLQQRTAPNPYANTVPFIDSVVASSAAVAPGATVVLSATTHDVDPGDTVTPAWSAPVGVFDNAASNTTTWTAPAEEGTYNITLTVTDGNDASRSVSLAVNVAAGNGRGSANVNASFNTWPDVNSVTANPGRVAAGGVAQLAIAAVDNDGDALTYQSDVGAQSRAFMIACGSVERKSTSGGSSLDRRPAWQ